MQVSCSRFFDYSVFACIQVNNEKQHIVLILQRKSWAINKRTKIIRIKTNRTWISFQCSFKWKAGGKRECKEPRVEAIYSTALLSCSTPTSSIVYMIYIAPRFERLLHCVKMNTNNNNCGGTGCKLLALKITGNQMIPYITTIKKNTHKCERQNRWKAKGNWFLKY